ncbi:MAG: methyltransferase [Acidithiobacillus sp.]
MSLHNQHLDIMNRPAEYADFDGLRILVPSTVYHPHEWSSTRFLLSELPDVRGLGVLEIGGGSGALSLAICKRGARKVVVTDCSERACATMECNALLNGLDLDVRAGNLFAPVAGETFDLVIFNLPLMDKAVKNPSESALCDPDGVLLRRFLLGLPGVVKENGRALFTYASISAPLPVEHSRDIECVATTLRMGGEVFRVMRWGRGRK